MKKEKMLTVAEAAWRLGFTYQWMMQLIKRGDIQSERVGRTGRWVRITEVELKRYEKQRSDWKEKQAA